MHMDIAEFRESLENVCQFLLENVCEFLLEELFCRYGRLGQVIPGRGELYSNEAKEFFTKFKVWLTLTIAYNLEANGKIECGNGLIMKALVKACDGRVNMWS